jgi:hypothetical protein
MGNRRDTITLRTWDGALVDSVSYEDSAPWPERADGQGATLERLSPTGQSSSATNWVPSSGGGSPGAPNAAFGPAILSIWHSPAVPLPSDTVTIYARTTNAAGACASTTARMNLAHGWWRQ